MKTFSLSPYSIPPLLSALLFALLGLIVYQHNRRAPANRGYVYWCASTFLWQATWTVLFNTTQQSSADLIAHIGYSFIIFIPITFYHFAVNYLQIGKSERRLVVIAYLIGLFFLVLNWSGTQFIDGVHHFRWGYYPKAAYPLHPAYLLFLTVLAARGQWLIYQSLTSGVSPLVKSQLKSILFAGCTYTFASLDFATNYGLPLYPLGVVPILLSLLIMAYAILRHRLMDFGLLMRWGIAYTVLIAILVILIVPVAFMTELISQRWFHLSPGFSLIFVVCGLVFLVDPLRKATTRFVDQIIFKSPDFQSILSGIELTVQSISDPVEFGRILNLRLKAIWGAEHAGIVLWDYKTALFRLFPPEEFTENTITRLKASIPRSDFLVRTLETERRLFWHGVIVEEELTALGNLAFPGEKITFWKIRRTMRWLGAAVCVPLMASNELIGFIVLGPKKSQSIYNKEDKKFLSHVADLVSSSARRILLGIESPKLREA